MSDSAALWTATHQAPLSVEPSRQEYCLWDSPGRNTEVGCYFPFQGIFLTQGSNLGLLESPALAGEFFTTSVTWEALRESGGRQTARCLYILPSLFLHLLFSRDFKRLTFNIRVHSSPANRHPQPRKRLATQGHLYYSKQCANGSVLWYTQWPRQETSTATCFYYYRGYMILPGISGPGWFQSHTQALCSLREHTVYVAIFKSIVLSLSTGFSEMFSCWEKEGWVEKLPHH